MIRASRGEKKGARRKSSSAVWLRGKTFKWLSDRTVRKPTGSHTLCSTCFTPVLQQHAVSVITSMNHCLLSWWEDGEGRQRAEVEREKYSPCSSERPREVLKENGRKQRARKCESERVHGEKASMSRTQTYTKFPDAENYLSAPIFSVWNQRQGTKRF